MIAYKGFDNNFSCRGFKYEVGKTYEMAPEEVTLCVHGFHACLNPADVLAFYSGDSRYAMVDVPEEGLKTDNGSSKVASHKITIVRELSPREMLEQAAKWITLHEGQKVGGRTCKEKVCKYDNCFLGDRSHAVAGMFCKAVADENGVAEAGRWGIAVSGKEGFSLADDGGIAVNDRAGIAVAGGYGVSVAKDNGRAVAGAFSVAVAKDGGLAEAGDNGCAIGCRAVAGAEALAAGWKAVCGDRGVAVARMRVSTGDNGLAVARGAGFLWAKGGMGAVLLFQRDAQDRVDTRMVVIDGKDWKADTWYVWKEGDDVIREQ